MSSLQAPEGVDPEDVKRKLWKDYLYSPGVQPLDVLEALQSLLARFRKPQLDRNAMLQEAADFIHRRFLIREVAIGLRTPGDGLYRYQVAAGMKQPTWAAHKRIAYHQREFLNEGTYIGKDISQYTRLFLAEDNPYAPDELETYDRPLVEGVRRRGLDESLEGDYLDIFVFGPDDDIIGWIEISGTSHGKLPDIPTIRWIELMGSLIGVGLSRTSGGVKSDR